MYKPTKGQGRSIRTECNKFLQDGKRDRKSDIKKLEQENTIQSVHGGPLAQEREDGIRSLDRLRIGKVYE